MNAKIWSLVATAKATVDITAAYIAHLELERDAERASEAIRLASVALDALSSATASIRVSLTSRSFMDCDSTQSIASRHSGESGACPCLRSAISSNTPEGPIDSKCLLRSVESVIFETPNEKRLSGAAPKPGKCADAAGAR